MAEAKWKGSVALENVRIGPWNSNSNNGAPIVIQGEASYDEKMSSTTDKDYIDARLKAMSDSLDQRLETAAAKSDGRLEVIETRLDGRLASIEHMLAAKFAALDANVYKTNADTIKWTVGLFITIGLFGLGLMTFLINNSGKFSAAQPPAATSAAQSGAATQATTTPPQAAPAAKP